MSLSLFFMRGSFTFNIHVLGDLVRYTTNVIARVNKFGCPNILLYVVLYGPQSSNSLEILGWTIQLSKIISNCNRAVKMFTAFFFMDLTKRVSFIYSGLINLKTVFPANISSSRLHNVTISWIRSFIKIQGQNPVVLKIGISARYV